MKEGCDYYYVKGDVRRRFTYLGKKSVDPERRMKFLAPVDLIRWHDKNKETFTCLGSLARNGAKFKEVVRV